MALTKLQRLVVHTLNNNGLCRHHLRVTGRPCFRLLDAELKPVRNIRVSLVRFLIREGYVHQVSDVYELTGLVHVSKTGRIYLHKKKRDD